MELFYEPTTLLQHLFEDAEKLYPNSVAVVFEDQQITYSELNRRAEHLSYSILKEVENEEIIGLSTTRSLEMIVGLLAILKAGKSYLPLDSTFPESRLQQILSSSEVKTCVSQSQEKNIYAGLGLKVISSDVSYDHLSPQLPARQADNAAVFYTSGSTGKPKGVCVPHRGLVNFVLWQKKHSKAAPGLKTLQFCHLGFDVSVEEIFVPLATGGTLYLITDHYRLDSSNLLDFIVRNSINRMYLPYVELQYFSEEANRQRVYPESLVEVITGGELLKITPQIVTLFNGLKDCPLMNKYGPTEACVWITEWKLDGDATKWPEIPTIGRPFADTQIFILNDQLEMVADGEVGEICAYGICVANGYLNAPDITAKSFINWTNKENETLRIYKTGDLGRVLPDGTIEFHGRRDGQVKIRGNRVELGDIEVAISQQKDVQQAVVIVREDVPGEKYLAAYLVNKEREVDIKAIREELVGRLPDYMIPSHFVQLDDLPKTSSGKVDRKLLPKPEAKRPDFGVLYRRPSTETEKNIATVMADVLQFDKVGLDDNFFELGGNSLLAQKAIVELRIRFKYALPITKLYQFPTIAGMAAYIEGEKLAPGQKAGSAITVQTNKHTRAIAVIGMAGRFPGADDIDTFWDNLVNERESISRFSTEELDPTIPERIKGASNYVPARGVLKDADQFDYHFFGMNPAYAEVMDPQHRLFLEISWEAIEKTRILSKGKRNNIGVFAGTNNNTYFQNNIIFNKDIMERYGEVQVASLNEKDYVASRTAYQFDLHGPAVSVYSACSTSLLAITQAVQNIRMGQCDVALAGGVSITSPINSGHLYQEGAIFSSDGHCRPFDAAATGTMFSDGAGVVVLKDFDQAIVDGDTVYAKILGVGINNDGGNKGSFSAPSAEGQAEAIQKALSDAGVSPSDISYVEAHGTATPLGDPIEIEGLKMAFGFQEKSGYCGIGSVKSNIGHLTAAAGVAGFIKTVLALHHHKIPASLGFETLNPVLDLERTPFYINGQTSYWKQDYPRRAGVSSFGIGGTNVHTILEEYINEEVLSDEDADLPKIVSFSAKTEHSLSLYAGKLYDWLEKRETVNLADVAYSINTKGYDFPYRGYLTFRGREDLMDQLSLRAVPSQNKEAVKSNSDQVVFLFPGQGAQYLNMGKDLYKANPIFREALQTCSDLFDRHLDRPLLGVIYPSHTDEEAEEILKDTRYTQPAIFAIEYALAKLWMSWGVKPSGFCGHSIGEYVAAHFSGILSLEDATRLVAARGKLISELSPGDMLSVRAPHNIFDGKLTAGLAIAAVNSPNLCVVAGSAEEIHPLTEKLGEEGILFKKLFTSHAFHSPMMEPILDSFRQEVEKVNLNPPNTPIYSTVTGLPLKDLEAVDPKYWTNHLRATVQFSAAVTYITMENEDVMFVEVGPGNSLSSLVRQHQTAKAAKLVSSLDRQSEDNEYAYLTNQFGQYIIKGGNPDWTAYYKHQKRRFVDVPTYAFDRNRCWIDVVEQPELPQQGVQDRKGTEEKQELKASNEYPYTKSQQVVREIWSRLLGVENIGIQGDFFELGGDSLIAVDVMIKMEIETGKKLPLTTLFQNPRLKDFAELFEDRYEVDVEDHWSCLVPIKPQGSKPPVYLVHAAGSHVSTYYALAKRLDIDQPVYGLQAKGLNGIDEPITSLKEMAAHYISEIIKHNPSGPYYIGGHSFGGYVAFEMAKQLKEMGKDVAKVIMFDIDVYQSETELTKWQKIKRKLDLQWQKKYMDVKLLFNAPKTFVARKKSSLKRKLLKLQDNNDILTERQRTIERIRKINHHAMDNYLISPYDGDIYLVRAQISDFYVREKKFYGWRPYVNNLHIVEMEGDHNSMFEEPLVQKLASKVQQVLDN